MDDSTSNREQLLEFPCRFPIKIMGRTGDNSDEFRDKVVDIVAKHVGDIAEDAIRLSPSRNGNFVSVTVTVDARSQEQLDHIYRELSSHDDVLFSL